MSEKNIIELWPKSSANHTDSQGITPNLQVFTPAGKAVKRKAIIVCPGGGYQNLAPHEGAPFAAMYAKQGYTAFVLTYRVSPNRFPAGHDDLCRAVRLVRSKADEYGFDADQVCIMGFSAGGHLVSTVATQPNLHVSEDDDLAGQIDARPDRLIMGYPVISFTHFPHTGSMANLLGDNVSQDQCRQFSNEQHVDSKTPPTFIFFTSDDPVVPVENALLFAMACRQHNVPVELHSYKHGPHGVGLATDNPQLSSWIQLLLNWLED